MYLAFDTETTGVLETSQILTCYFAILDSEFKITKELELNIQHQEYHIQAKAMDINKIDIVKHHFNSISIEAANCALVKFLSGQPVRLIPLAHNVSFDIGMIKKSGLLSEKEFSRFISWNILDTFVLANVLKVKGIIPSNIQCNLTSLAKYFGIEEPGLFHTAKTDTKVTIRLFKTLLGLINVTNDITNVNSVENIVKKRKFV